MKKEHLLIGVVAVLVVLNTVSLLAIWQTREADRPHHEGHHRPDKLIIERLQLDEEQQQLFEELKHEHRSAIVELEREAGKLHGEYFSLLKSVEIDNSLCDSLEKQLASITERKEEVTFDHFRKLKGICRPEQVPLFEGLVVELGNILSGPPGPPPHHQQ